MKMKIYILLFLFSAVIMGCGNKDKKEGKGFTYEKTSEAPNVAEQNANDVVITANDAMQFNKKEIRVEAGKQVKLTLKHIGKMDKNVMGHNFVLLKQGVDLMTFGAKAAAYKENGYIPTGTQDVIVHTKVIGGGEVAVIEFDAPKKGTYEFLCSFPGHYALMKGKFIVE